MSKRRKRSRRNKVSTGLVLIMLILIIIILGISLIIVNRIQQKNKNDNEKISLKKNAIDFEAGNGELLINASDILNGSSDKISTAVIDSSSVKTDKIGSYDLTISCDNKSFIIKVNVKDTVKPIFELHNGTYHASTGHSIRAGSLVKNINDATNCTTGFVYAEGLSDVPNNIKESVMFNEAGNYNIYVVVIDEGGNFSTEPVIIQVEEVAHVDYLNSGSEILIDANTDLNSFDTKNIPYGFGENVDSDNRPEGCTYYKNKYGKYAVDFIQPKSKYVFLTFDEGYEYGNTPEILDILKEKDAKAVFFVTLSFAKNNPDLIKRMIDEGHVIGNHSATHPSDGLCSLPLEKQIEEIKLVHDFMMETYNYEMYLFRFPTGAFSEQSLAVVQSMGYRSVFWSFAHKDWDVNNQPDVKESLEKALNTAHSGEIFLLHGVSTTDTKMLPDLIDGLRAKGFEIGYYAET